MALRRACSVVLACAAVAGLADHGSGTPIPSPPAQSEGNPARAYALDVTTAGRVGLAGTARLASARHGLLVSPLTVGAVAVFGQGDVLYGLRLADGLRLWSRAVGQDIAGMWPWHSQRTMAKVAQTRDG